MVASLPFKLVNDSNSSNVWAYITGINIADGRRVLLEADGKTLYFPENPPAIGSPLAKDCAIPLGKPGNTVTATVPQIAGGRVWFSIDDKLNFLLNPGPALVEPSVLNPSDPSANVNFGFCEFTLNDAQLYANISYVDFVSNVPIAITLENSAGATQNVSGMAADGLDKVCADLQAQAKEDGKPWDKLIVEKDSKNFRVLNPSHGDAVGANFAGYYEPYVEEVWQHYSTDSRTFDLDTQAGPGVLEGKVTNGQLKIGEESFQQPNTADIFGSNSGPFTTGPNGTRNAIIPRLAAGFNRTTLISQTQQPSDPSTYYKTNPTNHYCRIVHKHNLDGKGYGFAYDDVQPEGGADQSGKVNDGAPTLFTISVGGEHASATAAATTNKEVEEQDEPAQASEAAPAAQENGQQPMQESRPSVQQRKSSGFRGKLSGWKKKFMH
ncbi:glycoside hydrolase family 64 protein [Aureobasidium subglaciale EXF-2481]|uniref:Glycoside hydrolase family 64 protein n=1 Tax=Aureobasidium subglaciale (strain EXF-2481) TaxID=1043005 RepID=A0A074YYQ6_AURSE|nr:glycoside hydrolase family 64 protein [Aureobasidium subglaciale EXF-2481]KAI5201955.1 glucanase b [Aureobasidium subglaciale]KAI5220845.1 glucanase b [Aureobasidium subglaciale]KAI5224699.1 glucanase b [Aureobasidium subglaciale]KAI5260857.1 glucanase b [Aureobasidium subglaciale]KEQ99302.1 glycoside hydrolase family 64 protein [Aureobasidium subglaciale EXF-2481]